MVSDLTLAILVAVALGNVAILILRRLGYERAADVLGKILPLALTASSASSWREAVQRLALSVLELPEKEAREEASRALKSATAKPSVPPGPTLPLLLVLGLSGCAGAAGLSRGLEDVRDGLDAARPAILQLESAVKECSRSLPPAEGAAVRERLEATMVLLDLAWAKVGALLCLVVEDKTGCDR